MNETAKFYQSLIQDVVTLQAGNEDGDTQEQTFTRIAVEMLAEAGETENADIAYDEKDMGKRGQHKINAYAISENYETIDLFISIFDYSESIPTISKSEIDRATTRITNFFRKAVEKDYVNDVAESSQIFDFTHTLANFPELKENLVRVNAMILTNGEYKGDNPPSDTVSGYGVYYNIIDINHLYKIFEKGRSTIELDFDDFDGEKFEIPCLPANTDSCDYKAYIAIIPGACLSKLYERYGARLLEQNVRSFLQFGRKGVNAGIRDTIKDKPHMFFAFNNGIAATADYIELDKTSRFVKKISNLQIVNGGQTTAAIYNTAKKDKADISNIFVQVKFSIIENPDQYSEIVSDISRYANTQNKVNNADFSANNPSLIAFEKLSRYILSPITTQSSMQTCWFFERARGQYKTLRSREGRTKSLQNAFDKKYPKNQMFTKVELAKYINAYQEVWNDGKLVISPNIVVRGNERNYAKFIYDNLPSEGKINNIYFEDSIAKRILFKTAEKRYGVFPNGIGRERQSVVPYTLSLLNIITKNQLNLHKIWKNQQISDQLSDLIYDLMEQVNKFIYKNSPSTNYNEEAKKESLWNKVKHYEKWAFNINTIKDDLMTKDEYNDRYLDDDDKEFQEKRKNFENILKSISPNTWNKISVWGKDSQMLNLWQQNSAKFIGNKLNYNQILSDKDCEKAMKIYEIVKENNSELLEDNIEQKADKKTDKKDIITLSLIQKMVDWNYEHRVLEKWKWDAMRSVLNGKKELDEKMMYNFSLNLEFLKKNGFTV
jgi:hypothetical protein